jgi:hypothetical protein
VDRVSALLRDSVTFSRITSVDRNAMREVSPNWTVYATSVAASVQDISGDYRRADSGAQRTQRLRIYVDRGFAVNVGDRVEYASELYMVVAAPPTPKRYRQRKLTVERVL